jgi:hypothetical protein
MLKWFDGGTTMKKTHKTFKFRVTLQVSQNWIDDGVTSVNIRDSLKEWLEEELNPYAYEGEYIVDIK